jgi:hypothetical protein
MIVSYHIWVMAGPAFFMVSGMDHQLLGGSRAPSMEAAKWMRLAALRTRRINRRNKGAH